MKILAIRGKNIASLEGEYAIDFTTEPLFSTGIFAISGPTGAGKSTLLDTMCLALFGRTPRTSQAKENKIQVRDVNNETLPQSDSRFLLRRGTATGYAEVDFLGLTGYTYRARWSVGRAREKENGKLQIPKVSLYNLDKEQEEQGRRSEIEDRIEELIGLTFDQFTRSVLLAQNDFSTFLKADQTEKASLLEKLTGTEHYTHISKKVFEKTGNAKSIYDQVHARIEGIELLTQEEENELKEKQVETDKQLKRLEQLRLSKQELTEQVQTLSKQIETKKIQQTDINNQLEHFLSSLLETNKEINKEKENVIKAEKAYQQLLPQIRQATKLDIEIRSYATVVEEVDKRKQKAQESHKEVIGQVNELSLQLQKGEKEITKIKEWFIKFQDKEKVADQMESLSIHLEEALQVRKTVEISQQKINTYQNEEKTLEKELTQLVNLLKEKESERQETESKLKKEEEWLQYVKLEDVEKEISSIREEREKLLLEKARFVTTGDIRGLRDKLVEKEPCPVCGSLEHPYASPSIYEEMKELDKNIAVLTIRLGEREKEIQVYQRRQQDVNRIQQLLVSQEKEVSQNKTQVSTLENKRIILSKQIETENIIIKELEVRLSRALKATSRLFGNDDWQANWLTDPVGFCEKLEQFAKSWREKKYQLQDLEKGIVAYRTELTSKQQQLSKEDILIKEVQKEFQEKQSVYDRFLAERKQLIDGKPAQEVEEKLTKVLEQHRKQVDTLQIQVREQSAKVDQMRGVSGQIAKELILVEEEWQKQNDKLHTWIDTYNVSQEGLTIEQEFEQQSRLQTEIMFRLRTHRENLKKVEGFRKELNSSREIYERWAKLNDLIGSSDGAKFRKIAQGYTLDVLVNYANIQLKNLTHRYWLQRVPDTLALQVVDRDMCDEIRTVHSLSGGESFLVSLALALGLSSLSSNRMKVESLFIDEGFGSLDSDTLRVALDALESLRTQGRKIGVISHVQEMTERIPVQIKVCRSGNGRSYLEIV